MQDTELDADIQAALEALEATTPNGYFHEFESRLQARLEQDAMTDTSNHREDEPMSETRLRATTGETKDMMAPANSDLSDIRSLAAKTRESVSQRLVVMESSEDEPLISSISLALKTISLPEPGKNDKLFAVGQGVLTSTATAAREDEGGLPTWIWAAISAALAAAIVFFLLRGDKRETTTQVAANQPPLVISQSDPNPTRSSVPTEDAPPTANRDVPRALDTNDVADNAEEKAFDLDGETATGADSSLTGAGSPSAAKTTTSGNKSARTRAGARASNDAAGKTTPDTKTSTDAEAAAPTKKKADTLEDLLAAASANPPKPDHNGSTDNQTKTEDPKNPTRTKLDSSDVKKAMEAVTGKTRACYLQYQQSGLVTIKFSVEPSGKVTSAAATGKFKDTDTGRCVAEVVQTATFPTYDGRPSSFSYAFLLSQ